MVSENRKIVYFARHGQSTDNMRPVFQSVKSPLNGVGKQQAQKLAKRLKHIEFDMLISSPIVRAEQTAQIISKQTKHEIIFSELFVERIKPTSTDGRLYSDEKANVAFESWEESLYDKSKRVEDGENYSDLIQRAEKALDYLLEQRQERIVVVTHGFFLRTILAKALFDDYLDEGILRQIQLRFENENTGITVLEHKERYKDRANWRLWTFNDHSHFAE